jgi:hypothetical protein
MFVSPVFQEYPKEEEAESIDHEREKRYGSTMQEVDRALLHREVRRACEEE